MIATRFTTALAFVAPAAIVLLGADAAWTVLGLAATAGLIAMWRGRGPDDRPDRDDKLLRLTLVLVAATALLGALTRGGDVAAREFHLHSALVAALLVPAYAWVRRHPPAGSVTAVGVALGGLLLTAAKVVPLIPASSDGFDLTRAGVLGWLGWMLLAFGPAARFAHDARHPYAAARRANRTGLVLCAMAPAFVIALGTLPGSGMMTLYGFALVAAYAVARRTGRAHYEHPVERVQSLGVTLITKNEADRIVPCLESVRGWADEIVVLDSGSTDGTLEILRRYTDKVFETDWPGYGPQKQRALERASTDWVLSIDADEALTPELRHDIDAALGAEPACVGYGLPWGVIVYGKLLDFGRSGRAPLRLFRREGARFTDAQVHETVLLPPGRVGKLRGRLLHDTHRHFGHALEKSAKYAWLGAQKRHAAGKRGGGLAGAVFRAAWVFFQVYVVRLGFLDGRPGFVVAVTYSQGAFNKYAGLWALRRAERGPGDLVLMSRAEPARQVPDDARLAR